MIKPLAALRGKMMRPSLVMRGKTWGKQLQKHLRKPPVGFRPWLESHTEAIIDEPSRYVSYIEMRGRPFFLKLYRSRYFLHVLPALMRISRPQRTFRKSVILAAHGVPVPRPASCVLVPEGVFLLWQGIKSGGDYAQQWHSPLPEAELRQMMHCAGGTIAAMHTAGFTHGDCNWRNMLWSNGECYLVDFDGSHRRRIRKAHYRAQDLARFTVSAEESGVGPELLDIFLTSYLEVMRESRDNLVRRMRPQLKKLRRKHELKYGIITQPLI